MFNSFRNEVEGGLTASATLATAEALCHRSAAEGKSGSEAYGVDMKGRGRKLARRASHASTVC